MVSRGGREILISVAVGREELIRDLFERWNHGDREIDPAAVDPDAEVRSAMTRATYRGYGGIKDWMAEIDEQFDSWQIAVEEMNELSGDRVMVLGSVRFRGRASGVEFDQPIGWIITFTGERVGEMRIFPDHASARNAADAARP
jgi:ketosteroid isomerase-like protein